MSRSQSGRGTYDSFGNIIATPGSIVNNFRHPERSIVSALVSKVGADSRICTGDLAITNRSLY